MEILEKTSLDYSAIHRKKLVRKCIIEAAYKAKEDHFGSALSIAEIMEALYFRVANISPENCDKDDRDKIVLSKSHAALAQYACLYLKGFMDEEVFNSYALNGGKLPAHLDRCACKGVEISTGMSLGHGVGLAEGFAFANRLKGIDSRIFVVVGDGELQEGSIWEGLNSIVSNNLNEITIILDRNRMQASAETSGIIDYSNLSATFRKMGFEVTEVNGHDVEDISNALNKRLDSPHIVIAHTIKAYGIKDFENTVAAHRIKLTEEQYNEALRRLEEQ